MALGVFFPQRGDIERGRIHWIESNLARPSLRPTSLPTLELTL
jgi:hypothetical protein